MRGIDLGRSLGVGIRFLGLVWTNTGLRWWATGAEYQHNGSHTYYYVALGVSN